MPSSVGEAVQRAEELEREVHDEIPEFRLEEAVARTREALAIRQAYRARRFRISSGPCHSGSTRCSGNTGQKAHLRPPAWASGAWRCGGRRSPARRTSWRIRC
jgi:hypothetical protein